MNSIFSDLTGGRDLFRIFSELDVSRCCGSIMENKILKEIVDLSRDFICCIDTYPVILFPIEMLKPHENIDPVRLKELEEDILGRGIIEKPILVEYNTFIILDGHHRVQVLKSIGKKRIPALLIDYRDPCINVDSWRSDWIVSKELVIRAGLTGSLLPYKTSRHTLCRSVPQINISLNRIP
ncbi:MAG: ParB N-terminal domain-containing protein [Sulfolobales archaeon]